MKGLRQMSLMWCYIGFKCQSFSLRRDQELCPFRLDRVNSRWLQSRSWLAKVESISNTGDIAVKTYLRQGKECCAAALREKSEKKAREIGFFPCEVLLIHIAQITL